MKLKNLFQPIYTMTTRMRERSTSWFIVLLISTLAIQTSKGQQLGCTFIEAFDQNVTLSNIPAEDSWYTLNYNPAVFTSPIDFNGENTLQLTLIADDGQINRQSPFDTEEYDVQGRKFDFPLNALSSSIDVYIDPTWLSTDRVMSVLQFEALTTAEQILNIEIQIYSFDGVLYADVFFGDDSYSLLSDLASNEWLTLGVTRNQAGALSFLVGNDVLPNPAGDTDQIERILSVGIAGMNTFDGVSYSIFFDNLNFALAPDGCTDANACNFSPASICDDGSCEFVSCLGCTNQAAQNFDPNATIDDASCIFLPSEFVGLSYELVQLASIPGFNTYNVYLELSDPLAELIAIFGVIDSQFNAPLVLNGPGSYYQDVEGGNLSSDVNPALFTFVPQLQFDSYLTIGAAPGNTTVQQIGLAQGAFNESGLVVADNLGAVVYVIPGSEPAAIVGADGQILIAQITVDGTVEMTFNFQYNTGIGETKQIFQVAVTVPGIDSGCTSAAACNYNPLATTDDGSCELPGCGTPTACNYAPEASCFDSALCILPDGCTNSLACNYNLNALCDDGSCSLPDGCTDVSACNYNNSAACDDGSCIYPDGCTNALACNYAPTALCDNDSCIFPNGCTDLEACNYDVLATCDNGSCEYVSCAGCTIALAVNFDPLALIDDGSCYVLPEVYVGLEYELVAMNSVPGFNTYHVYLRMNDPSAELIAIYGVVDSQQNAPLSLTVDGSFYQNGNGGDIASQINPLLFQFETNLQYDSYLAIGAGVGNSTLYQAGLATGAFTAQGLEVSSTIGAVIFVLPETEPLATAGADERVFIGQFTMSGPADLLLNFLIDDANGTSQFVIGAEISFPINETGCTNPSACNYNPLAVTDDNSCLFPSCTDVTACNFDPAANCSDNSLCILPDGCTNPLACNYDFAAVCDNGSCNLPDGCTDAIACNYNDTALCDDGSCILPDGCTLVGACNYNPAAFCDDGSCDFISCTGCMDVLATNYEMSATINLGCVYGAQNIVFATTDQTGQAGNLPIGSNQFATSAYPGVSVALKAHALNGADIVPTGNVYNALGGNGVDQNAVEVVGFGTWNFAALINLGTFTFDQVDVLIDVDFDPAVGYNAAEAFQFNASDYVVSTIGSGQSTWGISENLGSTFWSNFSDPYILPFNPEASGSYNITLRVVSNLGVEVVNVGIVVEVVVPGCTYAFAANFNSLATIDNGTCLFEGCTDASALNFNPLANSDNGSCVDPIPGCTVSNATNFNPSANTDNGTCAFTCAESTCPADFNNDEIVNVNDLLVFLVAFGNPCQ